MSNKPRFEWLDTERLNPETLQNDLPWWTVVDELADGKVISEHDNKADALAMCAMLNQAVLLTKEAQVHLDTEFMANDPEIDSAFSVISGTATLLSAHYPIGEPT